MTRGPVFIKTDLVNNAGVAELADAPDLGSGGFPWGFESLHPHHISTMVSYKTIVPFRGVEILTLQGFSMLRHNRLVSLLIIAQKHDKIMHKFNEERQHTNGIV